MAEGPRGPRIALSGCLFEATIDGEVEDLDVPAQIFNGDTVAIGGLRGYDHASDLYSVGEREVIIPKTGEDAIETNSFFQSFAKLIFRDAVYLLSVALK